MRILHSLPAALIGLALPSTAQVTVDGSTTGDSYGAALAVQTVNTQFGDNFSELNAAYGVIDGGRLYLTFTGNIEDNFNKFEIFIDSVAGGENVLSGLPGNDGSGNMAGTTFDAGFDADYHIIVRRGFFGTPLFDLDISVLGTADFSSYGDVFGGSSSGSGSTGTGTVNAFPIEVAYDGSNVAGIVGGDTAADQAAALAVTTGLELSIDLADLGSPTGEIRVMAFQNNNDHNYASNQFLGGLPAPQGNLGGDGFGGFTGTMVLDMNLYGGDQFFVVPAPGLGTNYCTAATNSTGSGAIISAGGSASIGANDLTLSATPVPASQFGVFFYGPDQALVPFGNGFRCVASGGVGLFRLPVTSASAGQVLSWSVDNTSPPSASGQLSAGSTWNFQAWFRDPAGGGAAFNLSDGIEITFLP